MACALVNTISRHPHFLVLGACVRFRARTLHVAEPPPPKAVVPGGWIDLTREGFCYAGNFGILSFSVMAQSLVNGPYGRRSGHWHSEASAKQRLRGTWACGARRCGGCWRSRRGREAGRGPLGAPASLPQRWRAPPPLVPHDARRAGIRKPVQSNPRPLSSIFVMSRIYMHGTIVYQNTFLQGSEAPNACRTRGRVYPCQYRATG